MMRREAAPRARLERLAAVALTVWFVAVSLAAVGVHPAFAAWSRTQDEIREAITTHVPHDGVLVTNRRATQKFVPELDRKFVIVASHRVTLEEVDALLERHGEVHLALLDRTDSAWWREQTNGNAMFLRSLEMPRELLVRVRSTPTDDLHIWKLTLSPEASDEAPRSLSAR